MDPVKYNKHDQMIWAIQFKVICNTTDIIPAYSSYPICDDYYPISYDESMGYIVDQYGKQIKGTRVG